MPPFVIHLSTCNMQPKTLSLSLSCSQSMRLRLFHGFGVNLDVDLQAALSLAVICQVSMSIFLYFIFLFATSLNLNLGLPWFLFLSHSWEYSSCLGSLSVSILCIWPNHLRFFSMSISAMHGRLARLSISTFVILSYHFMLMMSLSCLIMYAPSSFTWVL